MKTIKMLVLFVILTVFAYAEQKVVIVKCVDGKPQVSELQALLSQNWVVRSAVAVTDSDSVTVIGKPKQAYTSCIVYILER